MKKIRVWIHKNQMLLFVFLIFIFLFYSSYRMYEHTSVNLFESFIKDILVSIENIITPKYKVNYQEVENTFTKEKEEELNNLRSLLDLQNQSSFSLEHASILNRSAVIYFDEITIDKGKNNGIDVDMLVITEKGVVGRIKQVTKSSAVVQLVTTKDDNFKVAVSVVNGENLYNGIMSGFEEETSSILITNIRSQSEIEIGSIVLTNGLGNLYPKGLTIGKVEKIENDTLGLSKTLKVKSEVDFNNLKYVSVVKGQKS